MIEPMAMLIGMNAATRAPKTRSSTIKAAGSPNFSSPFVQVGLRELGEVKAKGVRASDGHLELGLLLGGADLVDHVDDPFLGIVAQHDGHGYGLAVFGDGALPLSGIRVADFGHHTGVLERRADVPDESHEVGVRAGYVRRADDDDLVDAQIVGKARSEQVVGDHRVGPRRDARFGRECRREQQYRSQRRTPRG